MCSDRKISMLKLNEGSSLQLDSDGGESGQPAKSCPGPKAGLMIVMICDSHNAGQGGQEMLRTLAQCCIRGQEPRAPCKQKQRRSNEGLYRNHLLMNSTEEVL